MKHRFSFFLAGLLLGLSVFSCSPKKTENSTWLPPIEKKGDLFWLARDSSLVVITKLDSTPVHVQFSTKLVRIKFDSCGCFDEVGITFHEDGSITILTQISAEISLGDLSIGTEEIIPLPNFEVPEKAVETLEKFPFKHPNINKLHGTIKANNEEEPTPTIPKKIISI